MMDPGWLSSAWNRDGARRPIVVTRSVAPIPPLPWPLQPRDCRQSFRPSPPTWRRIWPPLPAPSPPPSRQASMPSSWWQHPRLLRPPPAMSPPPCPRGRSLPCFPRVAPAAPTSSPAAAPAAPWRQVGHGRDRGRDPGALLGLQHQQRQQELQQLPPFGVRTAVAAQAPAPSRGSELVGDLTSAANASATLVLPGPSVSPIGHSETDFGSGPDLDDLAVAVQNILIDDPHDEPLSRSADSGIGFQEASFSRSVDSSFNFEMPHALGQPLPALSQTCGSLRRERRRSASFCAFCKGNNEHPNQYMSHKLHGNLPDGTKIVTCQVLRNLSCDICHATGDFAHTRSHCPVEKRPSIAVLLKNTKRRCDGRVRKQFSAV